MRALFYCCLLLMVSRLAAQPIPVGSVVAERGHYVFVVMTPTSPAEATVWQLGETTMTTHRLYDAADSTTIALRPLPYPTLRTFFTTSADPGAAAGTERGITAGEEGIVIGELLHYPTLLSPRQRQLTESYLAIRHGLTLEQRSPINYLAPSADGTLPVWTATAAGDFRHRIVGLAHDSRTGLDRTRGNSVLAPELLQIIWRQRPDTTTYLLLADDDAPTARRPGEQTLQRRWRVETTGAPPPTTLTFDTRRFYDRAHPGEAWTLSVELLDGSHRTYTADATTDATIRFTDVAFPADTFVYFQLAASRVAPSAVTETLIAATSLTPNPVIPGQPVQLRVALTEPTALTLTVVDALGRRLEERRLPAASHHLEEVTFPAAGSFTLHLRPRRNATRHLFATSTSLTVVVQ